MPVLFNIYFKSLFQFYLLRLGVILFSFRFFVAFLKWFTGLKKIVLLIPDQLHGLILPLVDRNKFLKRVSFLRC